MDSRLLKPSVHWVAPLEGILMSKFELLAFAQNTHLPSPPPAAQRQLHSSNCSSENKLGVILDPSLFLIPHRWTDHKSCQFHLQNISKIFTTGTAFSLALSPPSFDWMILPVSPFGWLCCFLFKILQALTISLRVKAKVCTVSYKISPDHTGLLARHSPASEPFTLVPSTGNAIPFTWNTPARYPCGWLLRVPQTQSKPPNLSNTYVTSPQQ